jgi:predicted lipoprotein
VKSAAIFAVLVSLAFPAAGLCQTQSGEGTPIVPIATEEDYARVVSQTVDVYIVPAYRDLADATERMTAAVRSYCAEPDARGGENLDGAFAGTLSAWAGVDFLRFGPMTRESRYDRFAYFPDVHGTGARQLRQFLASADPKLLDPESLRNQSAAVQGLPALEQLLYAGDKALLATEAPEEFRCALAAAIAENADEIAHDALFDWTDEAGWTALIKKPGSDNPVYRTHAEAATEMLKALLTGLEQMRDQKILPAVGDKPDDAKAGRAPYSRSGHTMAYLKAGSTALQRFVTASGLLETPPEDQSAYAASALFEFSNLDNALDAAGTDIKVALADPQSRSKLTYAAIVLKSLRDLFQRHIAVAAGLTPGFNSLDGD